MCIYIYVYVSLCTLQTQNTHATQKKNLNRVWQVLGVVSACDQSTPEKRGSVRSGCAVLDESALFNSGGDSPVSP